ncbi:MAG: ferrous iron transport protein A [Planctomycetota bacterium]|nr:ferrous iron transport protein A [Planctomycetota bacterium]
MTRSRTSDVAKGTQIKLAEARKGHRVAVLDVQGESCEIRRLGELGVFPGACLEIVSVSRGGRVVLRLGSSKLALDASVGERVLVTPV